MSELFERVRDFLLGEPLPKEGPGTVTEWVRLADWSTTQEAVVIGLAAVVLGLALWNIRRSTRPFVSVLLLLLRSATLAVLLFAFYQPALLEERRARSTNTILLLVDDSASMALPHGDRTRRDLVVDFIRDHGDLWKSIEETNVLEAFRFSEDLHPHDWRDLDRTLNAAGEHTRIVENLEALRDRYRNRDIGGILLLTDGIDNGRAGRMLRLGGGLDSETERLLRSFGAPIYAFGLDGASLRDVSVHALRYSPFAFKRNRATIEADLRVHGYAAGTLEVELLEEGKLVRSVTRRVARGVTSYTASFDFTPEHLGHRVYTVRVKPFLGEVSLENNERHAVIRVKRDKIRVLQVAGRPSWDVRFLRNHLKRTPRIQLISFFILINTGSTLGTFERAETALIPFPADELFVRELKGFDLVVLQNFNYGRFSTPQHLHRVRDYVKEGGALLMVGGAKAFGAGGYDGTEITEVLPVEMAIPNYRDDAIDTTEFKVELTEEGKTHTVTQLSFDVAQNAKIWKALPPLEGINKMRRLVRGGIALARHPRLKDDEGKGMPVIAIGEPGEGRAAAIATDSLWRWKMPWVGEGGDDRHYDLLMSNMIRWLIKDPTLELVRVTPSAGVRDLGEVVELEVRIFKPDYKPAREHPFSLTIRRRPRPGTSEPPVIVHQTSGAATDGHGRWVLAHKTSAAGTYDVLVKATVGDRRLEAHTVFVVSDERPEMREVVANRELLEAIARSTAGGVYTLEDRNLPLQFSPPRVSEVTSRRYHERWNVPGVFILAALLLALEWWLRRRLGLT